MKILFFSCLIITSTLYGAAGSAAKKEYIVDWYEPAAKNLAVTSVKWKSGEVPGNVGGCFICYTDTPLSQKKHDQAVGKAFLREFFKQLKLRTMIFPDALSEPYFSEPELITVCRNAIAIVNESLPMCNNIQHRVLRYILAVKIGGTTLLTRVEAGDCHDHVLPPLPEGDVFENLSWDRSREVYIAPHTADGIKIKAFVRSVLYG